MIFFRKNFLWPHMFLKNVLLTCTMNFSKSCGPFSFAIGWVSYLTKWEAFLENIFWRLSYSYRNDLISYKLHNECQMTSWTHIKYFLMFVILSNTRWKKLNFFSMVCLLFFLFFKIFCFQQLISSLRIDILLAPNLLEYSVECDKIVMDVCKASVLREKR